MLPADDRTRELPAVTRRGRIVKEARTITLGQSVRPDLIKHIQSDLTDHEDKIEYLMRRNVMEAVQLLLAPSIFTAVTLGTMLFFSVAVWIITAVCVVAAIGLWLLFTYWSRSVICVTNQSIILKHDFPFVGDFHSMPLGMVASANSNRTVFGQIFRYKSVKIDGPGQMDQAFNWIPYVAQADEMIRAIRAYQRPSPYG